MKSRAAEWRARLILVALSIGATFIFAELAARALLRPPSLRAGDGTPIAELSPTLGWRTRALGAQRLQREDFDVRIEINSLGLRGPEVSYAAESGRRRLAIMGDSFAHGYYAEEPETLRGRLGAALGSCGVDVLNAGGPGYSTDQEWIYFDQEIRKYAPSEVVVVFYYNDLFFNVEAMGTANRSKPVFVFEGEDLRLVPPEIRERAPRTERQERVAAARRPAPTFHKSALWAFAASRLQRSRPDWARSLANLGLAPDLSTTPPGEFIPFGPRGSEEGKRVEEMWRRTEAILVRFRDDVRRAGSGFSVLYAPARFETNDDAWRFVQRRYEPDRPWNREAVRMRLAKALASNDIPLIDPTDAFRAAEASAGKAYLANDGHWNARGNEIAFESLLPTMRRAFGCAP